MSDFKHNAGNGALYPNKFKEEGSNQPDHKGSMTDLDGKVWDIAGWNGTTQAGDPKISIKQSKPYVKPEDKEDKKGEDLFQLIKFNL